MSDVKSLIEELEDQRILLQESLTPESIDKYLGAETKEIDELIEFYNLYHIIQQGV
jgi:hypothetical protein